MPPRQPGAHKSGRSEKKYDEPLGSGESDKTQSAAVPGGANRSALKKRPFDKHWRADEWAEVADFFVSFGYEITQTGEKVLQTRAIHYEGEKEEKWSKIAWQELLDWMIETVNQSLLPEDRVRPAYEKQILIGAPSAPAADPPSLTISDLKVAKMAMAADYGSNSSEKMRVEATVNVAGWDSELSTTERTLLLEVYLVDTRTQNSRVVAYQTCQSQPNQASYPIRIDFAAPKSGRHALYVTAQELPFGDKAYIQGPDIQVQN